jgi:conjugal transfer pilus assembly protein TraB
MNNENSLEETRKKQIRNLFIAVAVLVCVLGFLYLVVSGNSKTKKEAQKAEKVEFASPIHHVDAGSVLIERTEARLAHAEKTTEGLQRNVEELNKEKLRLIQEGTQEQETISVLMNRIIELERKTATSSGQQDDIDNQNQPALMIQGIRDDVIALAPNEDVLTLPAKNPRDYVPSGTFVKAVTLGGADASAATNAQSNPQPMLFRIIEEGTMPNNQKSRLKGCLATAAVVGDISSERGFIRLETLSCVESETNRIIDLNVEGTVFGPEGKGGIRGVPMWREGALLQRAFAAGTLSGLAGGLSQKFTKTSISPLGAVQTMNSSDMKDILGQGAASGLGNAMEKLADYNIRRAEQYHPVLQLSAGTEVELVFLKGFYLSDTRNNEKAQGRIMDAGQARSQINNLSNMPNLTVTPEQASRLKALTAELNG